MRTVLFMALLWLTLSESAGASEPPRPGVLLENLTWQEAEKLLTADQVIVIPLGAAAKEHGPHLKLNNDFLMAEYLKERVLERSMVLVAPTVNYHFFPAFLDYPGSVSLRLETARDLIVDICRTLANYGPRRFYVLNTGVSTIRPLKEAVEVLKADGILLAYTDILKISAPVEKMVGEQKGGSHADEMETSIMLYIAPSTVDMKKAVKDFDTKTDVGPLVRKRTEAGVYSPTGIYGDPTLATKEKGEKIITAMIEGITEEIEQLRLAPLPDASK